MLDAERISVTQSCWTFRVHFSAQVGDIVCIWADTDEYPTRITKVLSVEDGKTIICQGVAAPKEEIIAKYTLDPIQEAEARLAVRWCNAPLPMAARAGQPRNFTLRNGRWGGCAREIEVVDGLLECKYCGPVLFRDTEVGVSYPSRGTPVKDG